MFPSHLQNCYRKFRFLNSVKTLSNCQILNLSHLKIKSEESKLFWVELDGRHFPQSALPCTSTKMVWEEKKKENKKRK